MAMVSSSRKTTRSTGVAAVSLALFQVASAGNNCYNALTNHAASASTFCSSLLSPSNTKAPCSLPQYLTNCGTVPSVYLPKLTTACESFLGTPASTTSLATSTSFATSTSSAASCGTVTVTVPRTVTVTMQPSVETDTLAASTITLPGTTITLLAVTQTEIDTDTFTLPASTQIETDTLPPSTITLPASTITLPASTVTITTGPACTATQEPVNPDFELGQNGWSPIDLSQFSQIPAGTPSGPGTVVTDGTAFDGLSYWLSGSDPNSYYGLQQSLTVCSDGVVGATVYWSVEYRMTSGCTLWTGWGYVGTQTSDTTTSWKVLTGSSTLNNENVGDPFNLYLVSRCDSPQGFVNVDHVRITYGAPPAPTDV